MFSALIKLTTIKQVSNFSHYNIQLDIYATNFRDKQKGEHLLDDSFDLKMTTALLISFVLQTSSLSKYCPV